MTTRYKNNKKHKTYSNNKGVLFHSFLSLIRSEAWYQIEPQIKIITRFQVIWKSENQLISKNHSKTMSG